MVVAIRHKTASVTLTKTTSKAEIDLAWPIE